MKMPKNVQVCEKSELSFEQSIAGIGETDRSCRVAIRTSLMQLQLLFVTTV